MAYYYQRNYSSAFSSLAFYSVKKSEKIILFGNVKKKVNASLQKIVTNEINNIGFCAILGEYDQVIKDTSLGKLNFDYILTKTVSFNEGKI